MNFYKRFIGDYQRDTGHLSMIEHGAYALLLDHFYASEKPLPIDTQRLYRLTMAASKEERSAVDYVLEHFWLKTDGGWVNSRAQKETENAKKFSVDQKARINKRWAGKGSGNTEIIPDDIPDEYPNDTSHSHSHSQTPQPKPQPQPDLDDSAHLKARPDGKIDFELFRAVYPKRSGGQRWERAIKAANTRFKQGATFSAMLEGAKRYAAFCEATDKTGTEYVMQAATFLGPGQHFLESWETASARTPANFRNAEVAQRMLDSRKKPSSD